MGVWMRGAVAVLGVALVAALVPATAGAAPAPEEELQVYVTGPPGHRHQDTLLLRLYPGRRVAVVSTVENEFSFASGRGVAYAVRIPQEAPEDRIDIRFPGLGRIVGRFALAKTEGAHPCGTESGGEEGHFLGQIRFHGSGGYHRWTATHAIAWRNCPPENRPAKTLLGYVGSFGPGFRAGSDGPFSFLRAVDARGHDTGVVFTVGLYGRGPEEDLDFAVYDYEWLRGGVASMRWAARDGVLRRHRLEIAPGGERPASATIHPPAPFSGEATYSRKDGSLTGDLSVHLLGRTVRIAGKDTEAFLLNSL